MPGRAEDDKRKLKRPVEGSFQITKFFKTGMTKVSVEFYSFSRKIWDVLTFNLNFDKVRNSIGHT